VHVAGAAAGEAPEEMTERAAENVPRLMDREEDGVLRDEPEAERSDEEGLALRHRLV